MESMAEEEDKSWWSEMKDLEGEEDVHVKYQYYEIKILIAIHCEMEEEFTKSARKQVMIKEL